MPYAKVEPSGCGEFHGNVKVRFSFYLEQIDEGYDKTLVQVVDEDSREYKRGYDGKVDDEGQPKNQSKYDSWWDSLPKVWQQKPFHNHFLYFDPDVSEVEIQKAAEFHLANFYTAWCDGYADIPGKMRKGWYRGELDDNAQPRDQTRYLREGMGLEVDDKGRKYRCEVRPLRYEEVDEPEIFTLRKAQAEEKANLLKQSTLSVNPDVVARGHVFPATEIDVGSDATNRSSRTYDDFIYIDLNNPANDTGVIDTVDYFAFTSSTNVTMATFYFVSGSDYAGRDSEAVGNVGGSGFGSFTGLDIDIQSGDFLASHSESGDPFDRATSGHDGIRYKSASTFSLAQATFTLASGDCVSLYGTGETTGADHISSDTGSGADTLTLEAGYPVRTDAGSGSDASVVGPTSAGDSGAGVEALSALGKSAVDTGSGNDQPSEMDTGGPYLTIDVDGTPAQVERSSIRIRYNIMQRKSVAEFTVTGGVTPEALDEVDIDGVNTRYIRDFFGGRIKKITKIIRGVDTHYKCIAQDWNSDCEGKTVQSHYENTSIEDIIDDLFSTYFSAIDVSTYVSDTEVISEITFDGISLYSAMEKLAEYANKHWYIDPNKKLHWFALGDDTSPISVSDTPDNVLSFPCHNLDHDEDLTQLVNRVFVLGDASQEVKPDAVKYYNASTYTDYLSEATDDDLATHVPLDAMATNHYLYIGSIKRFIQLLQEMGTNLNSNVASVALEYSKGSGSWGSLDITANTGSPDDVADPDSVQFYDASAYTDKTANLTDSDPATGESIDSLDDSGDFLYIGLSDKYEVISVTLSSGATAFYIGGPWYYSVLSAEYSKGSGVWGSLPIYDGTKRDYTYWYNGQKYESEITMYKSGSITFDKPGDWATDTVNGVSAKYWVRLKFSGTVENATISELDLAKNAAGLSFSQDGSIKWSLPLDWEKDTVDSEEFYWVRLSVSAALSATVDLTELNLKRQVFAKVIAEDSYNQYGEYFDHKVKDSSILSDDMATAHGETILAQYSRAIKSGAFSVNMEGIWWGENFDLVNALRNIDDAYLANDITIRMSGATIITTTIKYGDFRPKLLGLFDDIAKLRRGEN